ncbi:putative metal dependent phosphohydrolase [Candidatus Nitrososphaera gargensis Ga9.2]|uniref:Putative metal dependent phosphohydrolase n=2 Tax=Candidatus Nitrososphaera gargensis TaxID=497727 RepID=K0IHZ6_NITGG|nr:putative metal dependent phosphohydrolase [Candidatus Nitrososphaera gargensis Ga9.2]
MEFAGEITDPVHRSIRFSEVEKEVIDSPAFQRLRRIRQLAGAHLIYPSAQHSRFEHSLGAMHIAGLAGETLLGKGYIDHAEAVQDLRLAALLHDIGHGPFSHLFEEVLEYRCNTTHEEMGRRIITQTEIADILDRHGHSADQICQLSFGQPKVNFMNEIISGGLSADIMDYLPRDGLFTGAEYAKVDYHRLTSSLEVSRNRLAINRSALNSLESMLISRYEMFKAVYFHKTVRSAEVMLLHSMIAADEALGLTDTSLDNYLGLTDEATLERLCALDSSGKYAFAGKMARDYRDRRLLKSVYEKFLHKRDKQKMDRKALQATAARIADAAGVDRNHVFVDASRAHSMPLTPSKEEMYSVLVVDKDRVYEMPVSEIPLVESISGFFDMLRVYTTAENRQKVERSVKKVLGEQETLYMGAGKLGR